MKVELELSGMSCNHCKMAVQQAMDAMDDVVVESVDVGRAVVSTDRLDDIAQAVHAAIEEEGFQVVQAKEVS